jgi:hypothetical protein
VTLTRAAIGEDTSAAPGCSGDALACLGDDTGPPPMPVALTSQARVDREEVEEENLEDLGEKMTESQSTGPVLGDLLDAIRKSQDMMVDATKRLVDTLQSARTSIPAPDLPKPEELVANVYNFTEQLIESQRKFAEGMLEATKPLRGAQEGPAAVKGGKK